MSTSTDPQPELPAGNELVAYLDGELPPEESRLVEQRLAADEDYRQQLRELDQAWEALNVLPANTVDDGFARTTIELATVAAADDLSAHTAIASRETRRHMRWWIAAAIAAAAIGFAGTRTFWPDSNNVLLADLPLIKQVDALADISSIEFLRGLSNEIPLEDFVADKDAIESEYENMKSSGAPSFESRAEWLKALQSEERADLAARARSFEELKREDGIEVQRLQQLAAEINAADDREKLQKTLIAYSQWLSRRRPGDQVELREELGELKTDDQVDRVRQIVRRESERASRELTADEKARLRKEIFAIAGERRDAVLEKFQAGKNFKETWPGGIQALLILHHELRDEERAGPTLRRLIDQLSPDTQAQWERMGRWRGDMQRLQQLSRWIFEAMQPKWGAGELEEFFAGESLDANERQRLLELPRAEMETELGRLYLISEFGLPEKGQWLRDFRGAGGLPRNLTGPDRREWRPEGPGRGGPGGPPPPDVNRPGRGPRGQGGMRGPVPPGERPRDRRPPDGPGPPRRDGTPPEDRAQKAI
jgi:hypothetical protein